MILANQVLIIHERLGVWARRLRPRLADRLVRIVETRSADDLLRAVDMSPVPIVLIDLGRRARAGLEDLDLARRHSPDSLILALEPDRNDDVSLLARELGATHVIRGAVTPPRVLDLLLRWLPLARQRTDASGWAETFQSPEPEPWNWLAPYLDTKSAS